MAMLLRGRPRRWQAARPDIDVGTSPDVGNFAAHAIGAKAMPDPRPLPSTAKSLAGCGCRSNLMANWMVWSLIEAEQRAVVFVSARGR